jgi:hypothetical protein
MKEFFSIHGAEDNPTSLSTLLNNYDRWVQNVSKSVEN